jgi:hypothetical protein
MNDKLLASTEREVLDWPGICLKTGSGDFKQQTDTLSVRIAAEPDA